MHLHRTSRLLGCVDVRHSPKNSPFARLLDLTCQDKFIKDTVYLVELEHNVQLTHVAKITVEQLDEKMDALHQKELVVCYIHPKAEIQARIPAVD